MILNLLKKINTKILVILSLVVLLILLFINFALQKKALPQPQVSSPLPSSDYSRLDQQIREEKIDDPSIGLERQQMAEKFPWLEKLPFKTESYVLVYNWQKEAIRARLIINPDSPLSYDEQVSKIKAAVEQQLKDIGVDLSQTKLYYTFSP